MYGKLIINNPEELFTKFFSLTGSLPDCAEGWPIQVCSTYYTALSRIISDRMMDRDDYTPPSLVGLDTKKVQLEALKIVSEGVTV